MALSPVRLRASMSVGSADTIAFTRSNSPALIASMKAALLEVVSGMPRFYRVTAGLKACTTGRPAARVVQTYRSAVLALLLFAPSASAQSPRVIEQPLLGATLTAGVLGDLPTGNSVFA